LLLEFIDTFIANETGVLEPRPKLLRFHLPLNAKERGMVKAEKGGLFHSSGHAMGRGRVSTQLSSAIFRVQT
jgi:hypothetical protein